MSTIQETIPPLSATPPEDDRSVRRGGLQNLRSMALRILLSDNFILYLTIAVFLIASYFYPTLSTPRNMSNQLSNVWPLLAVAIGQTFVLISAGIDLSVGAIMAFTSTVGAILITTTLDEAVMRNSPLWGNIMTEAGGPLSAHPQATLIGVMMMLLFGTLIGMWNGYAVTRFGIAPFMVTLVAMIFFSNFALWLTQSRNVANLPETYLALGDGDLVSVYFGEKLEPEIRRRDILPFVTIPAVISLSLAFAANFVLRRTVYGRQLYATGTNRRAAEVSGVPTKRVIMMAYMISGFCAGVAAILYSARLGIGQPTLGDGTVLLDIIGACIIGGTSLFGGKGRVLGTFIGVLFFVLLQNILGQMRLSAFHIDVVKGLVILAAAILDVTRTRLLGGRQ